MRNDGCHLFSFWYTASGTSSTSLSTGAFVDASGAWESSGTQSAASDTSANLSYSGSADYTRQVEPLLPGPVITGTTVHGNYTESGTTIGSSHYASSAPVNPDGSIRVTGSGTSDVSRFDFHSYSGSGTGGTTSADGSTSSTYTENGQYGLGSDVSTTFVANADGSWLATLTSNSTHGIDIGRYSYSWLNSSESDSLQDGVSVGHSSSSSTGTAAESHAYGFGGTVTTVVPSVGAAPVLSGAISGHGESATGGLTSSGRTDWSDTSGDSGWSTNSAGDTYSYQPSWVENRLNNGALDGPYNDPGSTSGASTMSNSGGTTDASGPYSHSYGDTNQSTPGFDEGAKSPIIGPTFPGDGAHFGYQGTFSSSKVPKQVSPNIGNSNWEAFKALGGQADDSVQTTFNHSVVDRGLGAADAIVSNLTFGGFTSVGGPVFDPANRADENKWAQGIILTDTILIGGIGAAKSLYSAGRGIYGALDAGAAAAGDGGALLDAGGLTGETSSLVEENQAISNELASCFRAGTKVLRPTGLQAIESIAPGRRVVTGDGDTARTSISPETHRLVRLHFVKDGQEFNMAFLRPAKLLEGLGAGDFMELSVLELEIRGRARVLAVEPCPTVEEGIGRVVTGAFSGQSCDIRLVKVHGLAAPMEITGNHPVFSEDRLGFVRANELRPGERLRTRDGVAVVESVSHDPGRWDVFNLEVESAHQYYVTERHVLVHNANGVTGISVNGTPLAGYGATGEEVRDAASVIRRYLEEGYTIEPSPTSDLRLVSEDGTKSVRFDLTTGDPRGPHINIETWQPRNLFPGDERMILTGNEHVFLLP